MKKKNKEPVKPSEPKCSLCGGDGKVPNPDSRKKSTCPHCQGSGTEPKSPLELEDDNIED